MYLLGVLTIFLLLMLVKGKHILSNRISVPRYFITFNLLASVVQYIGTHAHQQSPCTRLSLIFTYSKSPLSLAFVECRRAYHIFRLPERESVCFVRLLHGPVKFKGCCVLPKKFPAYLHRFIAESYRRHPSLLPA